jgi:hypothetical protein
LLEHHTAHESSAAGAERASHRSLAQAPQRPRERQVRQVCARDQDDAADRAKQQQQPEPRASDNRLLERHDPAAQVGLLVRLSRRDFRHRPLHHIQLCAGLFERDAGFEPPDDRVVELAHPTDVRKVQPEWHHGGERGGQQCRFAQQIERRKLRAGLQHTDDGVLRAPEEQAAAQHLWVASEPIRPESVADHHNRRMVWPFVSARQRSAEGNRHLKHVEDRA